jgi:hypothetical protein
MSGNTLEPRAFRRQINRWAPDGTPNADWVLVVINGGPYGIDRRAHEVGLPVSVARRSSNSGAPTWNAADDRQPCRTADLEREASASLRIVAPAPALGRATGQGIDAGGSAGLARAARAAEDRY